MKILSVDSSAKTASAALSDGEKIVKSEFKNTGLTHSETLLPMILRVMDGTDFADLDAIAITAGPGSFTGVRIGEATVKGLAFEHSTPCIPVSTLEAIAYNFLDRNGVVCAVMDARRMQFYNALFGIKDSVCTRLTPDRAIAIDDLREELKAFDSVLIAGDGAPLCYENIALDHAVLPDGDLVYQNAASIAKLALEQETVSPSALMPTYLRPSQAERELKLKIGETL